jgi:hypothetical protein
MSAKQTWKYFLKRERHAERRRIRRREKFLTRVGPTLIPENLSAEEATDFLFGSLTQAKRVVRSAERRQTVASAEGYYLPGPMPNPGDLPSAARPARVLSRLNRSAIFPPLLAEEIKIEAQKLSEILVALESEHQNAPAHCLLDALATASGLSWGLCDQVLLHRRLLTGSVDRHDLVATQGAREFRNRYGEGRARHAVLLAERKIQEFEGDWAYFDHDQFQDLLPGIIVPSKLKRHHYLTNWVTNGKCSSIDVYAAPKGTPLFQHLFFDRFNPLFFGKPRPNRDRR